LSSAQQIHRLWELRHEHLKGTINLPITDCPGYPHPAPSSVSLALDP
jgi:hypothetical protein